MDNIEYSSEIPDEELFNYTECESEYSSEEGLNVIEKKEDLPYKIGKPTRTIIKAVLIND